MSMGGIINTEKELSFSVPFYSVHRDISGKVIACVKPTAMPCDACIMSKHCAINQTQGGAEWGR